jgi:hypothetical protein
LVLVGLVFDPLQSESEAHSRVLETSVEALRRDASAAMFAAQRALEDAAQEVCFSLFNFFFIYYLNFL